MTPSLHATPSPYDQAIAIAAIAETTAAAASKYGLKSALELRGWVDGARACVGVSPSGIDRMRAVIALEHEHALNLLDEREAYHAARLKAVETVLEITCGWLAINRLPSPKPATARGRYAAECLFFYEQAA